MYDWRNLTNVMWVEQPVGVGFTQGEPNVTTEEESSKQFVGFYHQFAETFGVKGFDIFLTGESYAGYVTRDIFSYYPTHQATATTFPTSRTSSSPRTTQTTP